MVSEAILREIEELKLVWGKHLAKVPTLVLDDTWPSVGVLDLMTHPLRRRVDLMPFEIGLVRGVAAYIAKQIYDSWKEMGAEVTLEDTERGITVRASRGPKIEPGTVVSAYVERDVAQLLVRLPNPLPILNDFSRLITSEQQVLPTYTIAMCLGLSPFIEGSWSKESLTSMEREVGKVTRHLARSCADWYARVYPDEPLGQVPELYLFGLVFPPLLMNEEWPALHGVDGLCDFAQSYKVSVKQLERFAANLARSPEEQLSHIGFVFAAAVLSDDPSPELAALAQSKGSYVGTLRAAMVKARTLLGLGGDWLELDDIHFEQLAQIRREQELGFLPWISVSANKLATVPFDPELKQLVHASLHFDLLQATRLAQKLIEDTPQDLELRVQRIYLELVAKNIDRADALLKELLTEPECDDEPRVNNIAGIMALARGHHSAADVYFLRAKSQVVGQPFLSADMINNYGWTKVCRDRYDEALLAFDEAITIYPGYLAAHISRVGVLYRLNLIEEADKARRALARFAPTDRRVFLGLTYPVIQEFMSGEAPEEESTVKRNAA